MLCTCQMCAMQQVPAWNDICGQTQPLYSANTWPMIPKPMKGEWQMWQRSLQYTRSLVKQLTLLIPLGKWQVMPLPEGWYYHLMEQVLYQKLQEKGWKQHGICPRWSRTLSFHLKGLTVLNALEEKQLQVVLIVIQDTKLQLTGYGVYKLVQQTTLKSRQEELLQSKFMTTWQLQLEVTGSKDNLKAMLEMSKALAVSDGSF